MNGVKSIVIVASILGAAIAFGAAPTETALEAPGPSGPLKGTMLSPSTGRGAVVLIIPGSGPTDRDGNSAGGIPSPG